MVVFEGTPETSQRARAGIFKTNSMVYKCNRSISKASIYWQSKVYFITIILVAIIYSHSCVDGKVTMTLKPVQRRVCEERKHNRTLLNRDVFIHNQLHNKIALTISWSYVELLQILLYNNIIYKITSITYWTKGCLIRYDRCMIWYDRELIIFGISFTWP